MSDELTPNDQPPEPDDAAETPQDAVSGADAEQAEGSATEATEAAQAADTAVAVLDEETTRIPDPTNAELALMEINEATERVQRAWDEWLRAQRETKSAKEAEKESEEFWMSAVREQQTVIKGQSEQYPLFDRKWAEAKVQIAESVGAVKADQAVKLANRDLWRSFRLENTPIPSKIVAILAESNYHTVGDVANLTKSGLPLTDIKGIGEKKADQIESGLAAFWAAHPEFSAPKPTPPVPTFDPVKPRTPPPDEDRAKAMAEDPGHEAPDPDEVDAEVDTFEPPSDGFDPDADSQSDE